ncbi:hypothetical protein L9F63_000735, partial [Diploptera punctata]
SNQSTDAVVIFGELYRILMCHTLKSSRLLQYDMSKQETTFVLYGTLLRRIGAATERRPGRKAVWTASKSCQLDGKKN